MSEDRIGRSGEKIAGESSVTEPRSWVHAGAGRLEFEHLCARLTDDEAKSLHVRSFGGTGGGELSFLKGDAGNINGGFGILGIVAVCLE